MSSLTDSAAWRALERHAKAMASVHLRDLFAHDADRFRRFSLRLDDLLLDYSKNRITDETLQLLLQLAEDSGLRARIDAMFRGEKINSTEKRAVLHVALRAPKGQSIVVDGKNVVPEVHAVLDKMEGFANRVRSGAWKGHTGKRIRNIVNIGEDDVHAGVTEGTGHAQADAAGAAGDEGGLAPKLFHYAASFWPRLSNRRISSAPFPCLSNICWNSLRRSARS